MLSLYCVYRLETQTIFILAYREVNSNKTEALGSNKTEALGQG